MATSFTSYILSEAEQLLFYSIPGSTLVLYCAVFLLLFQRLPVSTGHTAAAAVATIPVGFLIYQAYTSNCLGVYERVNRRTEERTIKFLKSILMDSGLRVTSDEEVYRLSKRILTVMINRSPEGRYIWRLIGIVNARGACLFSTVSATAVPVAYLLLGELGLFACGALYTGIGFCKIVVYYVMLIVCGYCLYLGIPKVRRQLDVYNQLLVSENIDEVKAIATKWIKLSDQKVN